MVLVSRPLKNGILQSQLFLRPIHNLLACMHHKIIILFVQVNNKDIIFYKHAYNTEHALVIMYFEIRCSQNVVPICELYNSHVVVVLQCS